MYFFLSYLFEYLKVGGKFGWRSMGRLEIPDPKPNQFFGSSISIYGDLAAIGAEGDDENGEFSGALYLFQRYDGDGYWAAVTWVNYNYFSFTMLGTNQYYTALPEFAK